MTDETDKAGGVHCSSAIAARVHQRRAGKMTEKDHDQDMYLIGKALQEVIVLHRGMRSYGLGQVALIAWGEAPN